jgi:hypothetical protein
MYLDQHHVVTLEFHYYQNGCRYHNLIEVERKETNDGGFVDMDGKPLTDILGLHRYRDELVCDQTHFKRADA